MSLERARAKWERRTAGAGEKWKRGMSGAQSRYCKGLSEKLGVSYEACMANAGRSFGEGTGAISASDFQSAVSGKGSKWAEGVRRGIEGGH